MAGSALCSEEEMQQTDQVQNVLEFDGIEVEIIDDAQITQEFVESRSCSSGSNNNLSINEVDDEEAVDHPTNLEDQLASFPNVEPPTVTGSSSLALLSAASSTLADTIYHQILEDASVEPQPEAGEISQANNEEANPDQHPPTSSPLNEVLISAAESNEPLILLHPTLGNPNGDTFSLDSLLGMAETEIPIPSPDFFTPDHELPDIDQTYPLPMDESLNALMQNGDPVVDQSVHFEGQPNNCNVHDQPQLDLDDDRIMNMLSTDQFIVNFIRSMNQSEHQILFQSSFPQSSPPILNQFEPTTSFPGYHNGSYNGGFQPFRPQTSYHQTAGVSPRFDSNNNFVLPRALTPIRPETNEHQLEESTPVFDSRISPNYMPPRSNVPVFRPQFQRANAIPRTPIGTNIMHIQYPVQPQLQLAMPSHLRPQQYVSSQQLNQVHATPGSYNVPQAFQTIFTDQPMMQQRTKGWMSPSFNQVQYIIQNTNFPNRPQGSMSRAVRPTPSYVAPRSAIPSSVITSLPILPEDMGFDHSSSGPNYQIRTTSSNNHQQVMFGQQGNLGRRSFGIGESSSSPFKRFRRDLVTVEASNQNEQMTYQSDLQNNGGLDVPQLSWNSGPMKNSLYDPRFEGIGLPIDPHLRGMDFNFIIQGRYV